MGSNTALYTYDPNQVAVIIGGSIIGGFGDGTFVTIERNADSYALKRGTDGVGTRSKTNDKSGRVTVVLSQGSASNDKLSSFGVLDEQNNAGVVPITVRDASGRTLISAAQAWLVKPPTVEFGREATDRTYVFESNSIDVFNAGN